MWTERDQIQAYQFLRRRLVSALTTADPNHPVAPGRRLTSGVFLGGVATLLVTAGFGVSGLLRASPAPDWRHTGLVIMEQDGGGPFVLDKDGALHPVENLASARLLANGAKEVTVSASDLHDAPRGAALGIPGAPDALPGPGDMISSLTPVACSRAVSDLPKATGPAAALLLARSGDATAALTGMTALPDGRGLLAQTPKGDRYLVAGGVAYGLSDRAVIALGYRGAPLPVAPAWLSVLPSGRALDLVAVSGAGTSGPHVGGAATRVGQILTAANPVAGSPGYYLVRSGGLEPVSQAEAALVLADTANARAYEGSPAARTVSVADVAAAPVAPAGDDAKGYPASVPTLVSGLPDSAVVCATGDGTDPAVVALSTSLPLPSGARTVPAPVSSGGSTASASADEVYVPPGSAALVMAHTDPGAAAGPLYLVTDAGVKYALGDSEARSALGYGGVGPAQVPASALALLPNGPVLDAAEAQKPAVGAGG